MASFDESHESDVFDVEEVVGKRIRKGKVRFFKNKFHLYHCITVSLFHFSNLFTSF